MQSVSDIFVNGSLLAQLLCKLVYCQETAFGQTVIITRLIFFMVQSEKTILIHIGIVSKCEYFLSE